MGGTGEAELARDKQTPQLSAGVFPAPRFGQR